MPASITSIGIDVSKNKLDVAFTGSIRCPSLSVPNNVHGMEKLLRICASSSAPVIMEATGKYHQLCASTLVAAGTIVSVLNPYHAKKLTDTSVRQRKTDALDAQRLAVLGVQYADLPRFVDTRELILLKNKVGLLSSLEKQLQGLAAVMKSYEEGQHVLGGYLSDAEKTLMESVRLLRKQKTALEKEIHAFVLALPNGSAAVALMDSVPGLSPFTAALLVIYLDPQRSASEWVAYLGFDVSMNQSGKTTRQGFLTKRGNKYLRKRLYGAAWGATRNSTFFQAYYTKLRSQDRTYPEAICIIARKLLTIAHAVLTTRIPYNQAT